MGDWGQGTPSPHIGRGAASGVSLCEVGVACSWITSHLWRFLSQRHEDASMGHNNPPSFRHMLPGWWTVLTSRRKLPVICDTRAGWVERTRVHVEKRSVRFVVQYIVKNCPVCKSLNHVKFRVVSCVICKRTTIGIALAVNKNSPCSVMYELGSKFDSCPVFGGGAQG